jgi:hypothetical protein
MKLKKTLGMFAATALLAAASASWAADDPVTQGGSNAQSTDRGAHDMKKEHSQHGKKTHAGGASGESGRAAHDGRKESAEGDAAKEHAGTEAEPGAAAGRSEHSAMDKENK